MAEKLLVLFVQLDVQQLHLVCEACQPHARGCTRQTSQLPTEHARVDVVEQERILVANNAHQILGTRLDHSQPGTDERPARCKHRPPWFLGAHPLSKTVASVGCT
jgi:hypothetical protein